MTSNGAPLTDGHIADLLQRRAERITVHPDLPAVVEPALQSSTGHHKTRPAWTVAAVALLIGLLGAGSFIRTQAETTVDTSSGSVLSQDLLEFAAPAGTGQELLVWMNPDATSNQIQSVALLLADLSEVSEFSYSDRETTYDEFVNHYADSPEIIELVEPEQLPTYFSVTTTTPSEVINRIEPLPGVDDTELAKQYED